MPEPLTQIRVIPRGTQLPTARKHLACLRENDWDDFGWRTTFELSVVGSDGGWADIGAVKISQDERPADDPSTLGSRRTMLPQSFKSLDPSYFSVGQDSDYYERVISALGLSGARALLASLNDLSLTVDRVDKVLQLDVGQRSFFRFLSPETVRQQFSRLVSGGARTKSFNLSHHFRPETRYPSDEMGFHVVVGSNPPSNVHVLIGSNGFGKTRTLRAIRDSFTGSRMRPHNPREDFKVAGVVYVSFSAFDARPSRTDDAAFNVVDVGLDTATEVQSAERSERFRDLFQRCASDRPERLEAVLAFLDADPYLHRLGIAEPDGLFERLHFDELSSGHKIVLLALVSLLAYTEEKTLVLIDEPETHLHPPLLSAFTRATSWLLADRNGLAIAATHSPVVLQEVPRNCAWVLWRSGDEAEFSRPAIETFGENVGVLTREVFGLQVDETGFHALLKKAAGEHSTWQEAVDSFHGQLGAEAKALLRVLMLERPSSNE